jgi:ATP-binding cassette subfamily B protein
MSGHGGPWGRMNLDPDAIKNSIKSAPKIEHLLGRIFGLFAPHRVTLTFTIALVLLSAGMTVLPPLLIQDAFNNGLFPADGKTNLPLLSSLVGFMMLIWLVSGMIGVLQTYLTSTVGNKVMGQLRVDLF